MGQPVYRRCEALCNLIIFKSKIYRYEKKNAYMTFINTKEMLKLRNLSSLKRDSV